MLFFEASRLNNFCDASSSDCRTLSTLCEITETAKNKIDRSLGIKTALVSDSHDPVGV